MSYKHINIMIDELGNETEYFAQAEIVRDELKTALKKSEAFDELSTLIAKRYEAEKERHNSTDQYSLGVYYTLNNLNGVIRGLESTFEEGGQ